MTSQEINFLGKGKKTNVEEKLKLIIGCKRMAVVLAAWLLIFSAVFGYVIYLGDRSKDLKAEKNQIDQQLILLKDKISRVLILKERLGKIDALIKGRNDLSQPLVYLIDSLPEGVDMETVSVSDHSLKMVGSGNILSISQLADYYTAGREKWYEEATLGSLVKNKEDDTFNFSLTVGF